MSATPCGSVAATPEQASSPLIPLKGVRVADFSSNMAGPFATMILAQLGADVVKIEPLEGDDARAWPPAIDGMSISHRHMNAGKRGLALDLKKPQGLEVALKLMARSDVILQSMRPGVAKRLGVGPDKACALNPDALYYDLNAFGAGPLGQSMPGYDPLVQAFSGIMQMTGHEGMPPTRCAPSLIDLGTGQWIAMGVLAALMARRQGQPVARMETALVDTAFSLIPYQAATAKLSGQRPAKAGSGNPIAAPYQCYRARDGDLMLAAPNQRLWEAVAGVLEAPELTEDARFLTVADRSRHVESLETEITARLAECDVADWIDRFTRAGVPVTRASGLEQAVESEITAERGTFIESGAVPLVRLPWLVNDQPVPWRSTAPRLGQHSLEILAELGYDADGRAAMVASGAIGT